MIKGERVCKLGGGGKRYTVEEIYSGITRGVVGRRSLGWNMWLGASIACAMILWMVIYVSRLLIIAHKLKGDDSLMEELRFDEQLATYGYNVGSLSLSILAFCRMEESPSLLNIPMRLGLSNQILKQRYMVRNSLEKLNELRYPKSKLDQRQSIEGIIANTITLLKQLVPLNFMFEDQPSPISPAPPPFYVPYRTNITEEEIKRSIESDSNTFLAAKYLCNNTEYISNLSETLQFKAFNITNSARLFDLDHLHSYFKKNDIIRYQSTRWMLISHYVVVVIVALVTIIVFYLGSNDFFQRKTRIQMMDVCKKQMNDIFESILSADEMNKSLIQVKFKPVCKIFKSLKSVCDGIIRDYEEEAPKSLISSFQSLSVVMQEFESCVELGQEFSEILGNELRRDKKESSEPVKMSQVIEDDIRRNSMTKNSHHFSENIPSEIYLYSGIKELNEVLSSMLNVLSPNVDKSIFWDIVQVKDSSLIPSSMINSIGEISTNVMQVLESNWNRVSAIKEEDRDYTFLTIDVSPSAQARNPGEISKEREGRLETEDGVSVDKRGQLLEALEVVTRSFHLLVAKRIASCVFGGILVSHGSFGEFNSDIQVDEFRYVGDISGVTLIIPVRKKQRDLHRGGSLARTLSNYTSQESRIYVCGLDNNVSNLIESVSRILGVSYMPVDCWEIKYRDDLVEYFLERPGYWLIDTSVIHFFGDQSRKITNLYTQSYYLENNIDIVLLDTFGRLEVVSEYNNDINLNQFYYSLKYFLSGKTCQVRQSSSGSEDREAGEYRQLVRLLNRPISEINGDLLNEAGTIKEAMGEKRSLIGESCIRLVDVRELLFSQKKGKAGGEGTPSRADREPEIRRPEILGKEWYNVDLLEMSVDELKEIASFLIYYRFREVIRDKEDYEEDVSSWPICQRKIKNFVSELAKYYHVDNPFHNFHHAVSISITLNQWLDKPSARHSVSSLEAYCLMISALAHDLDHPGVSNEMVGSLKAVSRRAIHEYFSKEECGEYLQRSVISTLDIYSGFSVLENHHSSLLFVILGEESSNIMPPVTSKLYPELRKMMINSIILTDMFHHGYLRGLVSGFTKRYDSAPGTPELQSLRRKVYLSILLHSVDISNPLMNTNIYLKWSKLVYEEMENQKRLKLMLDIPLNDTTDRFDYESLQVSFINTVCMPYFQALLEFDSELVQDCIQNLYFNREYFKKVGSATHKNRPFTP
ncbi:putative phosphdiesterase [Cryptosporidium canis]|uniref:Phosphodiesterase n=1 Tax=Cryptosporidium canis TaxID=195482 RepID=A0A9D5HV59_9CRYT|nr:putative phosphdiesterase [Cryptosporidium canis]